MFSRNTDVVTKNYQVLHLFCGSGGGALGFQNAQSEFKHLRGKFETICGIDVDAEACVDFEKITGSRAIQMDLFTREDYILFHGKEPSADWREIEPEDIRNACNGVKPDAVFLSPPCKGYSGLLPEASAKSAKYQALNRLVVRSMWLVLEAFRDKVPPVILLENVPRITSRGKKLLLQTKSFLHQYGYVFNETVHDCGEVGGLGQKRKRYLLIARQQKAIPQFIYQPPKQRLKGIGEVIGKLPMPDHPSAGPMHRLPRLAWKTWVRLALIPAGGDWRDLEDFGHNPRAGAYKIIPWIEPSCTVTSATKGVGTSNGASAVADPRLDCVQGYANKYAVEKWEDPSPVITGSRIGSGAPMVADPRLPERKKRYPGLYRVESMDEPSNTVIGQTDIQCGALSVADDRVDKIKNRHASHFRVIPYTEPSGTVTGATHVANGLICVQDVRLGCKSRSGTYGVMDWEQTASTVIGSADVHAGCCAVADIRIPNDDERLDPPPVIISIDGAWHRPLTTLELAVIQSFPTRFSDGTPLKLAGDSDSRWRERIGNAVPPAAAQAMAETILYALLVNDLKEFVLGATPIWVMPELADVNEVTTILN